MLKKNFLARGSSFLLSLILCVSPLAATTLDLNAQGAVLMDAKTGTVLYSKNKSSTFFPASTTKVLTCLLLLSQSTPYEILTKTAESIYQVPSDSSHIGLNVGEKYSAIDGIHGIMMGSDNFISYDMAIANAGSIPAFANKMNQFALSIGATDSHFINPHGYHDPNHYTTPYDLALITRSAFANLELSAIAGTQSYDFQVVDGRTINIQHTSQLLDPKTTYYNPYVVASKTGYHTPAGRTLVAKAVYPNIELIGVVMKATNPNQFADMNKLLSYGAENFSSVSDLDGNYYVANLSFSEEAQPYIELAIENKWISSNTTHYGSQVSRYTLINLLAKVLPLSYRPLFGDYLGDYPTSIFTQQQPITKQETALILYDLVQSLAIQPYTWQHTPVISDLTTAASLITQKAIRFTVGTGLLATIDNNFQPDALLTYEEAIMVACKVKQLFDYSIPNLFLPLHVTN